MVEEFISPGIREVITFVKLNGDTASNCFQSIFVSTVNDTFSFSWMTVFVLKGFVCRDSWIFRCLESVIDDYLSITSYLYYYL